MLESDKKYIIALGKNIKERREELGYSLIQFANKAKLSKGQLHKIEHGANPMTITVLRRISKALDTTIGKLCDF
ncbi:MAG: helix-turn-helix domain-containing protein [Bacteroidia bacterium]